MARKTKKCFLSYAHSGIDRDTLEYFLYVLKDLLGNEVQLLYDQTLKVGENFSDFMGLLDEVDAVLLVLTPAYKSRVAERSGAVYEEFRRIWTRFSPTQVQESGYPARFEILPVLFSGSRSDSTPDDILQLKQLDLTSLRVARKQTGEFVVPQHARKTILPEIQRLATQIHTLAAVNSADFAKLSDSYYDRLFVDLKASFNNPALAGHDYLSTILVKTTTFFRIESQLAHVVIGRKGSGKSTITQVLPLMHPDRYQGIINIVADEFNLESLYSLYSDRQFRSDADAAVSRDVAFELTWEALLMLAAMDESIRLADREVLSEVQVRLLEPIRQFIEKIRGTSSNSSLGVGDLFNYAFSKIMEFVRDCIDGARSDPSVFLVDIGVRFNRARYLHFVFGKEVLEPFRHLVRTFLRRFLITLDGFDTAFDKFRLESIRMNDDEKLRRRAHFEVDWLRSLLSLALRARDRRDDYFYGVLDFCIAAPKDRFMEVTRVERDSYRHWHRWCTLNWSGIELSILLRKRLEVLISYQTKKQSSPRERLEEVLRQKALRGMPNEVDFDYNGKRISMPLFMYVLRHTFWRPREVLIYYAALLALVEDMKRWGDQVTADVVRKCVKATTRKIIESEFLSEFHSTVVNIEEIVRAFKKMPLVMPFDTLKKKLLNLDFKFASGSLYEVDLVSKIKFLYEIGFLGVKADRQMREQFGLDLEHAFYFNEGAYLLIGTDEGDMESWEFLIHPIFIEYLRLDPGGHDLVLQYNWEYLRKREAFLSANPDA